MLLQPPATMLRFVLALSLIGSAASLTHGFDGIQAISTSTFKCLKNNGYDFFIARVWESVGQVDNTGTQNIKNAKAAGWAYVDGYIFPCTRSSCPAPATQISDVYNHLKSAGANYGMLWLDIEIYAWSSDHTTNQNFINAMGEELDKLKVNWGIYSNNHNWENIVGINWSKWSHKPLWWANYNGHDDLTTGFVPFGGWSKPAIHQWKGTTNGPCSVSMDLNVY